MSTMLTRIHQDIATDTYYSQNYSDKGQRFLAWYLRNIYQRTPIQARDDITDGPNDKEIDAVIVDDEKQQVIIIQSKFYTGAIDHEPLLEIVAAWAQIQNLADLQAGANEKLKVKLAVISEALQDNYEVVFELVTTAQLTHAAQHDLQTFQNTISDLEHPVCSLVLVDEFILQARWDDAIARPMPKLQHSLALEAGKYLSLNAAGFRTVLAAIRLSECLKFPGVKDGMLFRKNVRQSLGLTNKVNKGLKQTISGDSPQFFFLFHNGITALCEKMQIDPVSNQLTLEGLSVVNGCQSLTTILSCSVKAQAATDAYILFRFYEIPQNDLADKISINTNSQSAVKPRDLRSNDKRVVALKRAYENTYRDGFFISQRGQERPADRDATKTIDVAILAKCLMAWHCQRPNISYNENALFDKYFDKLFHSDYAPIDIMALNLWIQHIERLWNGNALTLNDALLAAPSYSKYHLMYATQACFCAASSQLDKVPLPSATIRDADTSNAIISVAANCYNSAFDTARDDYQSRNKVFSPQNWLKNNDSILKVQAAVRMFMGMMPSMPGGKELRTSLTVPAEKFMLRWSAD